MRMRKKKWVQPFIQNEREYLLDNLNSFNIDKPIYMEIGMGMGDFICESALKNHDIFYIGLEKEDTCVARAIKKAKDLNINNFKIIYNDASNIEELIPCNKLDLIYLHFPDPWPKKRNNKRRLTYPIFLNKYEKILKDKGLIIFKTDNEALFNDSLEYFNSSNFELLDINRNYFNELEPMTAYQKKFYDEGKPIYYAKYEIDKV